MTLPPALRSFLGANLSVPAASELESLYSAGDGLPDDGHDLMRLLPPEAAVATTTALRASSPSLREEILILWADDNGNYAGCHVHGQLAPRVVILDDEFDDAPRFHSPRSFQEARRDGYAAGRTWYDLVADYPARTGGDYPLLAADRQLALAFLRAHEADPSDSASAHCALQLIPFPDTELILPLLRSDDMWVQERACRVLGLRQYSPAIDQLRQVALHGRHNGRIAALLALRGMPSPEAQRVVAELRARIAPEFHLYLR